ncbi:MAG: hypothetical protein NC489_15495 [Ruminococcus flavefaciens]|nr:hypothetical protein [Ruminococcus flavefaciens]
MERISKPVKRCLNAPLWTQTKKFYGSENEPFPRGRIARAAILPIWSNAVSTAE